MYPALLKNMSILFLIILTLLAPTQPADNMFHPFIVFLCVKKTLFVSSLHCIFANIIPCPLVLFPSLTEKYSPEQMFLLVSVKSFCFLRRVIGSINVCLFHKFEHYYITAHSLVWLEMELSNRQQYMLFDGVYNKNPKHISCGVPHGSLIISIYVNVIDNVSNVVFPMIYAYNKNVLSVQTS